MPETNAESEEHGVTGLACLLTTGGLIGVRQRASALLVALAIVTWRELFELRKLISD